MIEAPEVIDVATQPAAVIHMKIPRSDMMKLFGPAVAELMAALAAQGVRPAGALFAHHLRMSDTDFDFELGLPVSQPFEARGRIMRGELPAAKVARTTYRGPYEGLPGAWGEFMTWLKANGHEPAPDLWEVYLVGPEATSDPQGWRTQLNRPIAK